MKLIRAARFTQLAAFFAFSLALLGSAAAGADEIAEGHAYYLRYCASCHGTAGDGQGPMAQQLKEQPADLTKLGERFGTPLPAGTIARYIDGRDNVAAHGPRDMPVWGTRFGEIYEAKESGKEEMKDRIARIIAYLNTIQAKPHSDVTPYIH